MSEDGTTATASAASSVTQSIVDPSLVDQTIDARLDATLTATQALSSPPRPPPEYGRPEVEAGAGVVVGRYMVLSKLGAGAMGVVFAAYDPELDRKVALKLLRRGRTNRSASGRARLQREAQALAKLHHPNVVAVHDVGVYAGQLFIAMEFVAGRTLTEWSEASETVRPWHEVLEIFAAAGEGLAAAHDAGLVHRDFKPDNVMIGADGRVRVMDFGLARRRAELESSEDLRRAEEFPPGQTDELEQLTRTGAVIGTPAYMATEQFDGRLADARSDQFGFCVALYKTLYGERPFPGSTLATLMAAVQHGDVAPAPAHSAVPSWVRKVLLRGLAPKPADRHPSMRALLAALAADPRVKRRRAGLFIGLAATLGAGVAATLQLLTPEPSPTCTGSPDRVEEVWNEPARTKLRATFEATKLSYAEDSAHRVEALLDNYTQAWIGARVDACEATRAGEQSARLLDLRMACLDARLWDLEALVDVLGTADKAVVTRGVQAVAALPKLARCADPMLLEATLPPPEDAGAAAQVSNIEQRMAQTSALYGAGHYEEGAKLARALLAEAMTLDYAPLVARLRLRLATLELKSGEYEQARGHYEQAYAQGLGLRMHEVAAAAAADLVWLLGERLVQHEQGRAWVVHADALAEAVGNDDARAHYRVNVGNLAWAEANYEEAGEAYAEVLALRERSDGPEALSLAAPLLNLGNVAWSLGNVDEAHQYYERVLVIHETHLGPRHPELAMTLNNLGSLAGSQLRDEEARGYYERTLALWIESLGPDHIQVSHCHYNLAHSLMSLGELELGREHAQRAYEIRKHELSPDHPDLATSLAQLGNLALKGKDFDQAQALYEQSLRIKQAALGPEHPSLAFTYSALASMFEAKEQWEDARSAMTKALELREAAHGMRHGLLRFPLESLGDYAWREDNAGLALYYYQRALTIALAGDPDDMAFASLRFGTARAMWMATPSAGQDRPRATALLAVARAEARRAAQTSEHRDEATALLAQLDAWEQAHAAPAPIPSGIP